MQEATMLYRAPGPNKLHGHDVEYTVVDAPEVEAKLAEGWFRTAIEAGESYLKALAEKAEAEVEAIEEKAMATRDEAIQKLEELGATFDRRWGVSRLSKAVDEALAARAASGNTQG